MLGDIASMKVLPDADLEWLVGLETNIVGKIREPIDRMQAMGATNVPGMPPGGQPPMPGAIPPGMGGGMPPGMPGGMPGGPPPGIPGGGTPGVPGMRQEPQINPDELRRLMGAQAGA